MSNNQVKVTVPDIWTKEQYIAWIKTRGPVETWKSVDCLEADRHIKETALANLVKALESINMPEQLRTFVTDMARYQFGCMEVDELMVHLDCYPDYLESINNHEYSKAV